MIDVVLCKVNEKFIGKVSLLKESKHYRFCTTEWKRSDHV